MTLLFPGWFGLGFFVCLFYLYCSFGNLWLIVAGQMDVRVRKIGSSTFFRENWQARKWNPCESGRKKGTGIVKNRVLAPLKRRERWLLESWSTALLVSWQQVIYIDYLNSVNSCYKQTLPFPLRVITGFFLSVKCVFPNSPAYCNTRRSLTHVRQTAKTISNAT